jgi:hypothetical protein
MKKGIVILTVVLVVQIAVAVGVNITRQDYRAFEPQGNLLSFDMDAVNRIQIAGSDNAKVVLNKNDNQWQLPELKGFPADQGNVKRLLERLAKLEKGLPVATSKGAAKRFKVTETDFERKLTLFQGDKPQATLLVGTSPAFRKVHVRLPGENDIRSVSFNTYEVGVKPEDWIDKAILTHKAEDIQRLALPGFSLERHDKALVVSGLAADEETVGDEAKQLLDRVAGLKIRTVHDATKPSDSAKEVETLRYALTLKSGDTEDYVFSKLPDADYYLLKASPRDETFEVDTWVVNDIKEVTRKKLVRKKATKAEATEKAPKQEAPKAAQQSTQ